MIFFLSVIASDNYEKSIAQLLDKEFSLGDLNQEPITN